jgi:hypothetical protein
MRRRRRRLEDGSDGEGLRPADIAEIAARLASVDAAAATARDAALARRLRPLVERRVPLRQVEAVRELGASRLRFADGTALVVRGAVAGDVGVLATWVRSTSVPVSACHHREDGVWLVFAPPRGRRRLSVLVTGLDQPL